ncbi:pyridoxamine 5'-phosphate oxidase family protein [Frigidibacter sp. MR17.14]|uniref:HugZ family pyridoxamine 5'-phosphate oxidase n=1 Tax=Frigidibacter sp. MR17.14 TaxID=3126509 RepID=UPI003012D469
MPEPVSPQPASPFRTPDDAARALARGLLARPHAALATLDATGAPAISRIALGRAPGGRLLTLISDLAAHAQALERDPRCALLLGEPGERGDPLTHPRLSLSCTAEPLEREEGLRAAWLADHPKAKLYVDFADFRFTAFRVTAASLNGGFGKAYHLTAEDLGLPA